MQAQYVEFIAFEKLILIFISPSANRYDQGVGGVAVIAARVIPSKRTISRE